MNLKTMKWTNEQVELLRLHYPHINIKDVAVLVGRTPDSCTMKAVRLGITKRQKPSGATRVNAEGFLEQKIKKQSGTRRWKRVHVLLWEAINGPIPKGFIVTFKDGNKRNFDQSNLQLISRAEMFFKNSGHSYGPEIEQLVRLRCLIARKIGKQDKQKGEIDASWNDIGKLRELLFDTLQSLYDEEEPIDVERAKAISGAAQVIINSLKIEIDHIRATGNPGTGFINGSAKVIESSSPGLKSGLDEKDLCDALDEQFPKSAKLLSSGTEFETKRSEDGSVVPKGCSVRVHRSGVSG
nr:HNH endonuclease signature motif containing protein [Ferrovum sp.]